MTHPSARLAALVLAAGAALGLVACGDDGGSPTASVTTATDAAPSGGVAGGTPTIAAPVIEVVYKSGKVDGGGRKQVTKGQTVTLRVTADIVDEVHLHGYDRSVDTVVGQPVEIVFKADASGVFEAELEKKGLKLVEIEVR